MPGWSRLDASCEGAGEPAGLGGRARRGCLRRCRHPAAPAHVAGPERGAFHRGDPPGRRRGLGPCRNRYARPAAHPAARARPLALAVTAPPSWPCDTPRARLLHDGIRPLPPPRHSRCGCAAAGVGPLSQLAPPRCRPRGLRGARGLWPSIAHLSAPVRGGAGACSSPSMSSVSSAPGGGPSARAAVSASLARTSPGCGARAIPCRTS